MREDGCRLAKGGEGAKMGADRRVDGGSRKRGSEEAGGWEAVEGAAAINHRRSSRAPRPGSPGPTLNSSTSSSTTDASAFMYATPSTIGWNGLGSLLCSNAASALSWPAGEHGAWTIARRVGGVAGSEGPILSELESGALGFVLLSLLSQYCRALSRVAIGGAATQRSRKQAGTRSGPISEHNLISLR